jgi:hypothetical protein
MGLAWLAACLACVRHHATLRGQPRFHSSKYLTFRLQIQSVIAGIFHLFFSQKHSRLVINTFGCYGQMQWSILSQTFEICSRQKLAKFIEVMKEM